MVEQLRPRFSAGLTVVGERRGAFDTGLGQRFDGAASFGTACGSVRT